MTAPGYRQIAEIAEEAASHVVACERDAAYTRNVAERFDGLTHPDDHDGVGTLVDVWAAPEICGVDLTVPAAGIRLDLTPGQAEALGRLLIAEALRVRLADCCPKCSPLDQDGPEYPRSVTGDGDSLRASYRRRECGHEWTCWWNPDSVDGWPLRRSESAA